MQGFLGYLQKQDAPMYEASKQAFLKNGTDKYEPGELWKQPDLAETLKRIQKKWQRWFLQRENS